MTAITFTSQLYFEQRVQSDGIRLGFLFLRLATNAAMRFHCGIRQGVMPDLIPIENYGKLFLRYVETRGEYAIVKDKVCAVLLNFLVNCRSSFILDGFITH